MKFINVHFITTALSLSIADGISSRWPVTALAARFAMMRLWHQIRSTTPVFCMSDKTFAGSLQNSPYKLCEMVSGQLPTDNWQQYN